MIVKALSVTQPWANLIAWRQKPLETRTWYTPYRGWLLICATRERVPDCSGPYGVALAVAGLVDCRRMIAADEPQTLCRVYPGAWAWVLEGVQALDPLAQFPVRGQLGIFAATVPPAYERLIRRLIAAARNQGTPADLSTAIGLFDVRCGHCGRRYGWAGRLADAPPCPACGTAHAVGILARGPACSPHQE